MALEKNNLILSGVDGVPRLKLKLIRVVSASVYCVSVIVAEIPQNR